MIVQYCIRRSAFAVRRPLGLRKLRRSRPFVNPYLDPACVSASPPL